MSEHALLSPSSASRWTKCTPSARYELQFPDTESDYAKEGTLAHAIGELKIKYKMAWITKQKYDVELKTLQRNELYLVEMLTYAEDYAIYVIERYNDVKAIDPNTVMYIEKRVDMTEYIPEGFGTADVIIVGGGWLYLIDLKYGKGVEVSAIDNAQLKSYAAGAVAEYSMVHEIDNVGMTIYQPRIDNISTWDLSAIELIDWAESELKPKAELAFVGGGAFMPGEHCRFCRGKALCRANSEHNLELAQYDFKAATTLQPNEISDILDRAAPFINWINAVQEHALNEARNGTKWPHYKLVRGRSNRVFIDEQMIIDTLVKIGFKRDAVTETKVLAITKLEATISKAVFNKHIAELCVKPQGAPTLVPEIDPRPAIGSIEGAAAAFNSAIEDEMLS